MARFQTHLVLIIPISKDKDKSKKQVMGAMAKVVKVPFLLRFYHPLRSHQDIRQFLRGFRVKFGDNQILQESLQSSDKLHINFYESQLDDNQFNAEYDKVNALLMYFKGQVFEPPDT